MSKTAEPPALSDAEPKAQLPWFVVQLKPNSETIAVQNLARQGVNIFAPFEEFTARKGRELVQKRRALFPGYLFVSFDTGSVQFRSINSTLGVSRLVSFSERSPAQVPDALIAGLMQRCDPTGKLLPPASLKGGDTVHVANGPLADLIGTVEQIAPDQRVWVLLDILGKATRVTMHAEDLRLPD